jgi:hypothetical protein
MENILDFLQVDWVKTHMPDEEIHCNVIYMFSYICFTLVKIDSEEYSGDVYLLTLPYFALTIQMKYFINRLACAGLKFKFRSNNLYRITVEETRQRALNEKSFSFEYDIDDPATLEDLIFERVEDAINNYCSSRGREDIKPYIFEMALYFKYYENINITQFATGNRWVKIGKKLLIIAKNRCNEVVSAVIMSALNDVLWRLGGYADIKLIQGIKEFASQNTSNAILARWNNKMITTIDYHNRIFYEV